MDHEIETLVGGSDFVFGIVCDALWVRGDESFHHVPVPQTGALALIEALALRLRRLEYS
jgi:hypothetical protein